MSRWGLWGLEVGLILGLGTASVCAADPSDDSPAKASGPDRGSFLNTLGRWFGPSEKPAQKKAKEKPVKPVAEKVDAPAPKAPSMADQAAAEREREEQALVRRQKVCLKLMEIAAESHDEELLQKAEQLNDRAREIYTQRTAHLPCCRKSTFESDEDTLTQHLGPTNGVAGRSMDRPSKRAPTGQPASQARSAEELP
jgi:hypothetical protein